MHKNGKLFGFGVSQSDDWRIIANVLLILALTVSVLGVYMFIKIEQGDMFVVEKEARGTGNTLDQNLLNKTIEFYKSRALKFEEIKANKVEVADPSI